MKRIILGALITVLGTILTINVPQAQAVSKKQCYGGYPCRVVVHQNVVGADEYFYIRCGDGTVKMLFELETSNGGFTMCPGSYGVTAIKGYAGLPNWLVECWDGSGNYHVYGHTDGSWHNLGVPNNGKTEWCDSIYVG